MHQAIFVNQAAGLSLPSDAVQVEIDRLGVAVSAVRPVMIVVGLVVVQDPPQMGLVPDEGAVQEFAAQCADEAFAGRVGSRRNYA
jgi:hypothetical protein